MRRQTELARHRISRRKILVGAGALAAAAGTSTLGSPGHATDVETHGLSIFGDLKYPADFRHVD